MSEDELISVFQTKIKPISDIQSQNHKVEEIPPSPYINVSISTSLA